MVICVDKVFPHYVAVLWACSDEHIDTVLSLTLIPQKQIWGSITPQTFCFLSLSVICSKCNLPIFQYIKRQYCQQGWKTPSFMPAAPAWWQQTMSCYCHLCSFLTRPPKNRCLPECEHSVQQLCSHGSWTPPGFECNVKGCRCVVATSPIDGGVNSTSDSRSSPRVPAEQRVRWQPSKVLLKSQKERNV